MAKFSEEQITEIAKQAQAVRDASEAIAGQMAVLWQARVNMAMATGDPAAVRTVLRDVRSEHYMDNCTCV